MKAFVDENLCICCGLCEGICGEVFSTETGIAVANNENILDEIEALVKEACENCPVEAISIEE